MSEVELRHIVKHYGNVQVVKDLSLQIHDHEFLVLVGSSGCGKSTTLRMIAGLETPDSGDILIGSRRVNAVPPKDRDIAMVFQNYALYPHLTVFDNIAFSLQLRGRPKAEIASKVDKAAATLSLVPLLGRKPKELSGGQRQRVALARAIVREPQVFLMDEPLSNLDAQLRAHTRVEIKKLHQQIGATIVYVTHDQVEAMTMGDRIAVMRDGVIVQLDAPKAIYERPNCMFVAGFIGSPGMNFFQATVKSLDEAGITLAVGDATLVLPVRDRARVADFVGQPVVLGIRPEGLMLAPGDPTRRLSAVLDVVEPSGGRTYLHARFGDQALIADVETRGLAVLAPGDQVHFDLDAGQAHLFDRATERTVWSAVAEGDAQEVSAHAR